MSLDAFLSNLHADPYKSRPLDWEVDWADAPLPYKLYRGLPAFTLSSEVPLEIGSRRMAEGADLTGVGHLLWYIYGLTQWSHSYVGDTTHQTAIPIRKHRRLVPSGGGLYPNEIYIYLKIDGVPNGIYHYDAAHHRLILLRQGDFDSYLTRVLGNRCNITACFGTIFVSTVFWKNYFKYNEFAYRLQGLDTGLLIGQSLEMAGRFGFTAGVYYQFLDRAVNHLLGLSEQEESVYAVIPLSTEQETSWLSDCNGGKENIRALELCRELADVRHHHYVRSRKIKPYPTMIRMNEASMCHDSGTFRQVEAVQHADSGIRAAYLPRVTRPLYDLADICRKRFSPETEFVLGKVRGAQAAVMLQEALACFNYRNDLDGFQFRPISRVSLYSCMYKVDGIPDGAYRYDAADHALRRLRPGDHRLRLQQGMYLGNVNLFQVPLCFHVAGDDHFFKAELGYRGYRIQQIEAGILVQRLLLGAAAVGMGGRPLLGYQGSSVDELYNIAPEGKKSLIQIPIGPFHPCSQLEGGLHT